MLPTIHLVGLGVLKCVDISLPPFSNRDTWRYSLSRQTWTKLSDGKGGPSGRYGSVGVLFGNSLILHGGDDGGASQGKVRRFLF